MSFVCLAAHNAGLRDFRRFQARDNEFRADIVLPRFLHRLAGVNPEKSPTKANVQWISTKDEERSLSDCR